MITSGDTEKLTVEGTPILIDEGAIHIVGYGKLPYKTEYDFTDIPKENHDVFLQYLKTHKF